MFCSRQKCIYLFNIGIVIYKVIRPKPEEDSNVFKEIHRSPFTSLLSLSGSIPPNGRKQRHNYESIPSKTNPLKKDMRALYIYFTYIHFNCHFPKEFNLPASSKWCLPCFLREFSKADLSYLPAASLQSFSAGEERGSCKM